MTKAEYEAKYQEALSQLRGEGYFVEDFGPSGDSRRVRVSGFVYDEHGLFALAWGEQKASGILKVCPVIRPARRADPATEGKP